MPRIRTLTIWAAAIVFLLAAHPALAQDTDDLAKKLANPIASLISIPLEFDYDSNYGPTDSGSRWSITAKPVIPFKLSEDWNLITRTIIPLVFQDEISTGSGSQGGLSDILASFWFSPAKPTSRGLIWGLGPAALLPTATDPLLGAEKWGLGPTGVALIQKGPWTYGMLANHIWSVGGKSHRADVSNTFLQPFLSYTTKTSWTYALNTESNYNWEAGEWSVPINLMVSKLVVAGKLPLQLKAGLRYWAASPDSGPEGLGFKLSVTFLLPK